MIPIIRSLISLPAGMNRMPMSRFLLFTTLGSLVWTSLLTIGGMLLGAAWEEIIGFVEIYQDIVLVLLAVALLIFVGVRLWGRFNGSRSPAA